MITLSKADSQIVLYAKGHFKNRTNVLKDIRTLVAKRAGVEVQFISLRDVVIVLTDLLIELNLKIADPRFIESIIFGSMWQNDKSSVILNFVTAALDLISGMKVFDDLGVKLVDIQPLDPEALG